MLCAHIAWTLLLKIRRPYLGIVLARSNDAYRAENSHRCKNRTFRVCVQSWSLFVEAFLSVPAHVVCTHCMDPIVEDSTAISWHCLGPVKRRLPCRKFS